MISEALENKLVLYVNGNLPDDERSHIKALAASDPELRDEIRYLQALRDGIKNQNAPAPGHLGLARLRHSIPGKTVPMATNWWRPLAIAASLLVIVQTTWILSQAPGEPVYRPLSAPTGNTLQITFSPTATEAQIRKALQGIEATLVDGPGAAGIYRVRLPVSVDSPEYERALQKLRSHTDIITHVAAE